MLLEILTKKCRHFMNMDLKAEDLEDIILKKEDVSDFDPVMLSRELEKLSLENNPRDIFEREVDEKGSEVFVVKTENESDESNSDDDKNVSYVSHRNCTLDVDVFKEYIKKEAVQKSAFSNQDDSTDIVSQTQPEIFAKKNLLKKEFSAESNSTKITESEKFSKSALPQLFNKLYLSDSENEENFLELRERKPEKNRRHSVKRRAQGQFVKPKFSDVSDINRDRLRSLSGGQLIGTDKYILDQYSGNISTLPSPSLSEDYSFYGISNLNSVPDSGYATSPSSCSHSSRSDVSSPPPINSPLSPEFLLQTLDDEKFIEIAAELDFPIAPPFESVEETLDFIKELPAISPSSKKSSANKMLSCKPLKNEARKRLLDELNENKYEIEQKNIYRKISEDHESKKEPVIIFVEDAEEKLSKKQTTLHLAVLQGNKERIFNLIEIHKQYKKPFSDINIRDKYGKTALDYAVQKNVPSVVAYLKENLACQSVDV